MANVRDDAHWRAREAPLFDDGLRLAPIEGVASGDDFGFARLAISLALDDAPSAEDVFEIEDREVLIFQFFSGRYTT